MDQTSANGQGGVAALERGLSLLEAFQSKRDSLSLAQLAELTGFHKSTILRLSASLIRFGFLHRSQDGRFRLGPALFQLGRIYQRSFHLDEAVVPMLRDLVARTDETASFYVRDGDADTCLYRVDSPHPVRDAGAAEGDRFPVSDNSAGSRVLSAFLGAPGRRFDAIRRELVVVSRRSKRIAGAAAVVCPVFTIEQKLAGVLIISGPESRFSSRMIEKTKATLVQHAADLTRVLGGNASIFDRLLGK